MILSDPFTSIMEFSRQRQAAQPPVQTVEEPAAEEPKKEEEPATEELAPVREEPENKHQAGKVLEEIKKLLAEAAKPKPVHHETKPKKEYHLIGRPEDSPTYFILRDYLQMSSSLDNQEKNILGYLIEKSATAVQSNDPVKIIRYIKKLLRSNREGWGGKYLHRYLYRLLKM